MNNNSKRLKKMKMRKIFLCISMIAVMLSTLSISCFADSYVDVTPTALAGSSFGELVEVIFSTFTTVITGLTSGLKDAFGNIIYVDPAASNPVFSPLMLFIFTMGGIGIAVALVYKIFGMVKARRRG